MSIFWIIVSFLYNISITIVLLWRTFKSNASSNSTSDTLKISEYKMVADSKFCQIFPFDNNSYIQLEKGSSAYYNFDPFRKSRSIILNGTGFINCEDINGIPLVIKTECYTIFCWGFLQLNIRRLGPQFIDIDIIAGELHILGNEKNEKFYYNTRLTLNSDHIDIRPYISSQSMLWRIGLVTDFFSASDQVFRELLRIYNIKSRFINKHVIYAKPIPFSFDEFEPLAQVLKRMTKIGLIKHFNIEVMGTIVITWPDDSL